MLGRFSDQSTSVTQNRGSVVTEVPRGAPVKKAEPNRGVAWDGPRVGRAAVARAAQCYAVVAATAAAN